MRDLILKMSVSIDGFASAMDGRNAWMFGADEEAKAWSVAVLGTAGLHIMGSRTFQAMAEHWPTATDMFAAPMNRIPKAVFSRRPLSIPRPVNPRQDRADAGAGQTAEPRPGADSWAEATVASGDLASEVAALKAQGGKPIIAHGGVGFARSLVAQGLVDQFVLLVCPVALGAGLSVFSGLVAPKPLTLTTSRSFPGGAVAQTYRAA